MSMECDVLVVGGGPAGSSAALRVAQEGLKVLVVDKNQEIGAKVCCAEYIPRALLGNLPTSHRSFVVQGVDSMWTFLPNGTTKKARAPGLMIDRAKFDKTLAEHAHKKGAELLVGTRFVGYEGKCAILKKSNGSSWKIKPKVIIGADGPHSRVRRCMGIDSGRLIPAVQVRVALSVPMDHTEVYFHPRIYGGYGWVFPKGREANVGLAIVKGSKYSMPLRSTLKWFLGLLEKKGTVRGDPSSLMAGWIPIEPVTNLVKKNTLLVGDAAGHAHPISGGGVSQAVIDGHMAGYWTARAVEENNLGLLMKYQEAWEEDFGETFGHAAQRRILMESNWKHLENILPYCWIAFREYYQEFPHGKHESLNGAQNATARC